MADQPADPDREAILARRERFVARALSPFDEPIAGSRAKLAALAISGLTTACPCLDIAVPEETAESEPEPTGESETKATDESDTTDDQTGSEGTN